MFIDYSRVLATIQNSSYTATEDCWMVFWMDMQRVTGYKLTLGGTTYDIEEHNNGEYDLLVLPVKKEKVYLV